MTMACAEPAISELCVSGWRIATELAEPDAAFVRRQEVHEAAIVAARHAEQRQQRLVAAARLAQAAANELAQIVARDVASQEHRIDVLPERRALLDERVVQLVGDLAGGDRRSASAARRALRIETGRCSTPTTPPADNQTSCSTTFRSSRTLPGHR